MVPIKPPLHLLCPPPAPLSHLLRRNQERQLYKHPPRAYARGDVLFHREIMVFGAAVVHIGAVPAVLGNGEAAGLDLDGGRAWSVDVLIEHWPAVYRQAAADAYGLKILAELPIDPDLAAACDSGNIENYQTNILDNVINILKILNKIENWHQVLMPVFYHSRNSFINSKASASLISVNSPRISKNSLKYSAPTLLK